MNKSSYVMSRIKNTATKPELMLRRIVKQVTRYPLKYNFSKLPGKPDIFIPFHKVAIFMHGCFWHACSEHYKTPKTNPRFWNKKVFDNAARDRRSARLLRKMGISCLTVWEHELIDNGAVRSKVVQAIPLRYWQELAGGNK